MRLTRSPTVQILVIFFAVHLAQQALWASGLVGIFALDIQLSARPWALVTSVYAHASFGHLLANAIGLLLLGPLVSRGTTTLRFHAFFLSMGAVAGLAQVTVADLLGATVSVIGASGAIFALLGYLLAGNLVSTWLLDRLSLSPSVLLLVFLAVAVGLTFLTASPGAALVGHGTGLLLGLLAGRARVLRA